MSRNSQAQRDISRTSLFKSRRNIREKGCAHACRLGFVRRAVVRYSKFNIPMSSSSISIYMQEEPPACPRCGTAWRLKRGLCVSCLLSPGLETDMHTGQALGDVLDQ